MFGVLVKGLEFRESNAVAAAEDEVVGRFTTPAGQMESHSHRFGIVERNFLEHSYLKFVVVSLKFFVVKSGLIVRKISQSTDIRKSVGV